MIQFTYPWALLALLSIPILLVLYSLRPKRRTVLLSSTYLWREVLNEQQRGLGLQKLLRNLSFILLLLFALLLSFGLANPEWLSQTTEQYDSVLILDTSASMQTRTTSGNRFAKAKRLASELIAELADDARMAIMNSGRNPLLLSAFESNKDTLNSILAEIQASDEAGQPRAALALALSLMRNREQGQIYFISDLAFDDNIDFASPLIHYLPVVADTNNTTYNNVAITQFDFRSEIGSTERLQMLLTVHNYSQQALTVPITVSLNRQTIVSQDLSLPAGSDKTLVLPIQGRAYGQAVASIVIEDDLAADNHAYAVIGVNESTRVLLISPGNYYLESVLTALPNIHLSSSDKLADDFSLQVRRHDLIILDRQQPDALPAGNYLLINTLPENLPFQVTGSVEQPLIVGKGPSPLVAHLDLTAVRINTASKIQLSDNNLPAANWQQLFWSEQTDLAITLLTDDLRLVYLGFDLTLSNFPLQAAFPLFINQAISWLHPPINDLAITTSTQLAAGEPFALRLPPQPNAAQPNAAQPNAIIFTPPSGNAQIFQPDSSESAETLILNDTTKTGIYRYSIAGIERQFAINLTDEQESNILPRATLPQQESTAITTASERHAQLTIFLWPYIAAIALLILTLEWCLWCMRRSNA